MNTRHIIWAEVTQIYENQISQHIRCQEHCLSSWRCHHSESGMSWRISAKQPSPEAAAKKPMCRQFCSMTLRVWPSYDDFNDLSTSGYPDFLTCAVQGELPVPVEESSAQCLSDKKVSSGIRRIWSDSGLRASYPLTSGHPAILHGFVGCFCSTSLRIRSDAHSSCSDLVNSLNSIKSHINIAIISC